MSSSYHLVACAAALRVVALGELLHQRSLLPREEPDGHRGDIRR